MQPVPISATRLPFRSAPSGHRAVCHEVPANSSVPAILGMFGRLRKPTAVITARERIVRAPSGPSMSIRHSPAASSQVSALTSVSNWMCRRRSNSSATQSKYFTFCEWRENVKDFDWVADEFDLRRHIQFETEVKALTWDEAAGEWRIDIDGPDGARATASARGAR